MKISFLKGKKRKRKKKKKNGKEKKRKENSPNQFLVFCLPVAAVT